jgi:radical SAM protein with 4Fe4S-binding SPASM domain
MIEMKKNMPDFYSEETRKNFIANLLSNALMSYELVKRITKEYFFSNQYSLLHPETTKYIRAITPRRILNFISYLLAQKFGIFVSDPQPLGFQIETVRGCNFKCIMCDSWKFKLKFLPFEQVKSILKYFKDSLIFFPFAGGEPFINKDIYEISRYAYQNFKFMVNIASNFSLIDPKRALDMEAYELRASIDSINKDTFFEIRHGDIDKVKKNLVDILKLKRKQNKKYPIISISTVISKLNIHEIEDILNFGKSLGVRKFYLQTLVNAVLITNPNDVSLEDILQLRKILDKYEKELRINFLLTRKDIIGYEPDGYCFMTFNTTVIDFTGEVYPCCKVVGNKDSSFGNIFSDPQKVLKSRSVFFRKFRYSPPEFCKKCELYYRKPKESFYTKNKLEQLIFHKNFLE